MQEQEALYCSLAEVIGINEANGLGSVVLDAGDRVVAVSPLARQLVAEGVLRIDGDALLFDDPANRQTLQSLLAAGTGANAVIDRPGQGRLFLRTARARLVDAAGGPTSEYRMLLIRDPAHRLQRDGRALATTFNLTPRESELACHLAAGVPLADFARQRHVSINTVKSHLKQIFRKLDVHNQVELVACVWALLR